MKKTMLLLCCIGLLFGLSACRKPLYKDGVYEGHATGYNGELVVEVGVEQGKIAYITIKKSQESLRAEYDTEQMITEIIKQNSTKGVDAVAGSTISGEALKKAVENALEHAK